MRTDLAEREFPYICHAVRTPIKSISVFFSLLSAITVAIFFLVMALDQPADEPLKRQYFFHFVALGLLGFAFAPIRAGFREVLPNRVVVVRGATWVVPRALPAESVLSCIVGVALVAGGVLLVQIFGGLSAVVAAGPRWIILGPGFILVGAWVILYSVWQQLRGIKMTPESITYWRGIGRIRLAWDELGDALSTNDVRDHERYRKYLHKYQPGAKIVVPIERVMDVKLMVHWQNVDTPRLLLETDHFTVEPSALLTAILALRDNPELRPLLSTREAKALFRGPPWRVRRHMYRTQQWWPRGAQPDGIAVDSSGVVKEFQ